MPSTSSPIGCGEGEDDGCDVVVVLKWPVLIAAHRLGLSYCVFSNEGMMLTAGFVGCGGEGDISVVLLHVQYRFSMSESCSNETTVVSVGDDSADLNIRCLIILIRHTSGCQYLGL